MDKLIIADPAFIPKPVIPNTGRPLTLVKPKRKKLKHQDFLDMDMDNLEEELARLGFLTDDVPMHHTPTPEPERKMSRFQQEIIRRREEGEKMKEPMYDEDGCPILPDGSSRLFTIHELMHISRHHQARLCQEKPMKKPVDRKKMKLRKNPPPKKVDIEGLFKEEIKRREMLDQYN